MEDSIRTQLHHQSPEILNERAELICQNELKSQIEKVINFNIYTYTPRHKIFFIRETYNLLKL